jgi:hypothetical protein
MTLDKGQKGRGRVTKGEDGDSPWLDFGMTGWTMGEDGGSGLKRDGRQLGDRCLTQSTFLSNHHHTGIEKK